MAFLLTADIGGTNARFGLTRLGELRPQALRVVQTADSPSPDAAARRFIAEMGEVKVTAAVIAWAGPLHAGPLKLTNGPWSLDPASFRACLGLDDLVVINDFEAVAHATAHLGPDEVVQVGGGPGDRRGVRVVMGPGTGLGTATVVPVGADEWRVLPGEGGHTNPPLAGPSELALWPQLFTGIDHPVAENLLSGPGILRTYRALAAARGEATAYDTPIAVTNAARSGADPTAVAAMELFFTWLGRMAGDLALIVGASGGVYIAGGIVPKHIASLQAGPFRAAFEAKGHMSAFARSLPVFVLTAEAPALIGCASYYVDRSAAGLTRGGN